MESDGFTIRYMQDIWFTIKLWDKRDVFLHNCKLKKPQNIDLCI